MTKIYWAGKEAFSLLALWQGNSLVLEQNPFFFSSTKLLPHFLSKSSTILKQAPSARLSHLVARDANKCQRRIENNQVVSIHYKLYFLVTICGESLYISVALVFVKRNCGRSKNSKRSEQVYAVSFLRSRNFVDSGEKSVTSKIGKWFRWVPPVNWRVPSDAVETSFSSLISLTVNTMGWIMIVKLWNELPRSIV